MRRLPVALALVLVLPLACDRSELPGAPPALPPLLSAMPASAVQRGLFLSVGDAGFGSLLGLGDLRTAFGLGADDVTAVLESGEPPVTVLLGAFDVDVLADRFRELGYDVERRGGWRVLQRATPPPDAPPIVAAVPAAALREDLLVLGGAEDTAEVVDARVAADVGWIRRAAAALGPAATAAAFGPPPDVAARARRAGVDGRALLERAGVEVALAPYAGYVIGGPPTGVVALAYEGDGGGSDAAAALALRLATATVLDHPSRRTTDVLEPGAPRWRDAAGVVVLPVEWTDFDPARLRADLEAEALPWLVPLGGQRPADLGG